MRLSATLCRDAVRVCDRRGNPLSGGNCPVAQTLDHEKAQQCTAFLLHKNGHRSAIRIHTRPILEYGDAMQGVDRFTRRGVRASGRDVEPSQMYGCLDAITSMPSPRLTRAVINECIAGAEESHVSFGLLRIRLIGFARISATHGPQSAEPFLRIAAHTLRNSLGAENFLGCWEENEFLAVLTSASPMMVATTADILSNLFSHSEVSVVGRPFPDSCGNCLHDIHSREEHGRPSRRDESPCIFPGSKQIAGNCLTTMDLDEDDLSCFRLSVSSWFSAASWPAT